MTLGQQPPDSPDRWGRRQPDTTTERSCLLVDTTEHRKTRYRSPSPVPSDGSLHEDRTAVNGHPRQAEPEPTSSGHTTILADKRRPTLHATRPNTHDGRQQPPTTTTTTGRNQIPSTNPTTGHGVAAAPPRTPTPPTQPATPPTPRPHAHTTQTHTAKHRPATPSNR